MSLRKVVHLYHPSVLPGPRSPVMSSHHRSPRAPGQPELGLADRGAAGSTWRATPAVVRRRGAGCGPARRPEPELSPGKPRPSAPPLRPAAQRSLRWPAPPLPGRPWRAGACAIAFKRPDRDGGRFGVAAARRGVGRSGGAVDRSQRPEFRGNSPCTPPGLTGICFPREIPSLRSLFSRVPGCQPGPSALQLGAAVRAARLSVPCGPGCSRRRAGR